MATAEECRHALSALIAKMSANAVEAKQRLDLDRTLAYRVVDLDTAFHGRLANGQLVDLADGDNPSAKIRIASSSDDLVALVEGHLNVASAWASGRVKIHASVFDLIKLRKLM
jgi:putative sterol carrier protein